MRCHQNQPASQPARRRRSRTDKISPQRIHCPIRMHSCGFVQLSSCNSVWKATIVMKIMTYDLFAGLQWYLYFCTCYAVLSLCFWSTTILLLPAPALDRVSLLLASHITGNTRTRQSGTALLLSNVLGNFKWDQRQTLSPCTWFAECNVFLVLRSKSLGLIRFGRRETHWM